MSVNPDGIGKAGGAIAAALAAKSATQKPSGTVFDKGAASQQPAAAKIQNDPQPKAVLKRPARPSEKHVLFISNRLAQNFVGDDAKRRSFEDGFYMTDVPDVIDHLKRNLTQYQIIEVEQGPLKEAAK